jgi:hypothetical protein
MGVCKSEEGLMPIRLAETFKERLEYCRTMLKVHGLLNECESDRIKQEIKDGKCVKGDRKRRTA